MVRLVVTPPGFSAALARSVTGTVRGPRRSGTTRDGD
jgi:hypothetical protein